MFAALAELVFVQLFTVLPSVQFVETVPSTDAQLTCVCALPDWDTRSAALSASAPSANVSLNFMCFPFESCWIHHFDRAKAGDTKRRQRLLLD
jgi:hypothetical protein